MKTFENSELVTLAEQLAKSDSEKDVIKVLQRYDLWNEDDLWRDYGDIENNYSSIGNQMESADTALTEKLINSCDSLLMLSCLEAGIEPESNEAPKSISKAIETFFDVKEGVISYLSETERSELSENIGLVATGGKTNPCYTIFDRGLGQSPSQFPTTFLSLNASNKVRIPFVQGKFNMGSTGALPFCGDRNIQLILSKKNPPIAGDIDDRNLWGITVVSRASFPK